MKLIAAYNNGNYNVAIYDDGTKIRDNGNDSRIFTPEFPESIDLKITNYCDKGCKFCLKPSAQIVTQGGSKSISEIQVGDQVASFDTIKNQIEYKSVAKLYKRPYNGKLYKITDEQGHTITCTPNHKIYTKNRGYVRADELTTNDLLIIN